MNKQCQKYKWYVLPAKSVRHQQMEAELRMEALRRSLMATGWVETSPGTFEKDIEDCL